MIENNCKNLKIETPIGDLLVGYTKPSKGSISIHGELKNQNPPSPFVFFQFYKEVKARLQKKWIIDNAPNLPYYSSSDGWSKNRWSDEPTYDLCSPGAVVFYTLLAKKDDRNKKCPEEWKYDIVCGFKWGMESKDNGNIEHIPIKVVSNERLETFVCLLRCYYKKGYFELNNESECKSCITCDYLW